MAHPKHRISKHKKRIRRSHLALDAQLPNHCGRCGAAVRPHRVCDSCGHYGFDKGGAKGTAVLQKEEY
jgi:large subunit ribosomal protein L32